MLPSFSNIRLRYPMLIRFSNMRWSLPKMDPDLFKGLSHSFQDLTRTFPGPQGPLHRSCTHPASDIR